MTNVLIFDIEGRRFAIPLDLVERVVRMVSVTPLPQAPEAIAGVVNYKGEVVPVLDLRKLSNLPQRQFRSSDCMIVLSVVDRTVCLPVDAVEDVAALADEEVTSVELLLPGLDSGEAVGVRGEDLIFLLKPERISESLGLLRRDEHAG